MEAGAGNGPTKAPSDAKNACFLGFVKSYSPPLATAFHCLQMEVVVEVRASLRRQDDIDAA
jgi:hypothetical protein